MTMAEAIEIIRTERACVVRASTDGCARDCENCDLLRPTEDILEGETIAIKAMELPNKLIEEISRLQTYKCFEGGEKLVELDAVKGIILEWSNTVDNDEE